MDGVMKNWMMTMNGYYDYDDDDDLDYYSAILMIHFHYFHHHHHRPPMKNPVIIDRIDWMEIRYAEVVANHHDNDRDMMDNDDDYCNDDYDDGDRLSS